jgi:hypothetical protein
MKTYGKRIVFLFFEFLFLLGFFFLDILKLLWDIIIKWKENDFYWSEKLSYSQSWNY